MKPANQYVDRPAKIKSKRSRARVLAMEGVYQWLLTGYDYATIETQLHEEPGFNKADLHLFHTLLEGVFDNIASLQALLQPCVDRPLGKLSPVEHAILLVAAYELQYSPEIPYEIVLNEAIELAKRFGGNDGHKYVNGVLHRLAQTVRAIEIQGSQRRQ